MNYTSDGGTIKVYKQSYANVQSGVVVDMISTNFNLTGTIQEVLIPISFCWICTNGSFGSPNAINFFYQTNQGTFQLIGSSSMTNNPFGQVFISNFNYENYTSQWFDQDFKGPTIASWFTTGPRTGFAATVIFLYTIITI